mgnify:CR=1 FL=1
MTTITLINKSRKPARPVGRQTKHCSKLITNALEYITNYDNPYYLPNIAEMCRKIGVSRTQFYEWLGREDRDTNLIMAALDTKLDELMPAWEQRHKRYYEKKERKVRKIQARIDAETIQQEVIAREGEHENLTFCGYPVI